ncbi:MAG TPA: hypothetical protein VGY56_11000 [Verrucomicrobiae bacterium]|nr:hypothetical protein [Verrucomicrobiae bacterium]
MPRKELSKRDATVPFPFGRFVTANNRRLPARTPLRIFFPNGVAKNEKQPAGEISISGHFGDLGKMLSGCHALRQ